MRKNFESKSLLELYQYLHLPVDLLDVTEGFTIFNLRMLALRYPINQPPIAPTFSLSYL
ncbi:hypothetical protein QT327_27745 [Olivibacter sp. 47]|uniref:hypothetical protein n=1 Tax=Olivibacter sp. 47 TaxID=3056486 RepID=UPI0025A3B83D|nr:hypothetical protein [Olivibacter sp. 47]MDM8178107.1 hypothetical protein [Olivibacter sp. 47]